MGAVETGQEVSRVESQSALDVLKDWSAWAVASVAAVFGAKAYVADRFDRAVDLRISEKINPPLLHATLTRIEGVISGLDSKLDSVVEDVAELKGQGHSFQRLTDFRVVDDKKGN